MFLKLLLNQTFLDRFFLRKSFKCQTYFYGVWSFIFFKSFFFNNRSFFNKAESHGMSLAFLLNFNKVMCAFKRITYERSSNERKKHYFVKLNEWITYFSEFMCNFTDLLKIFSMKRIKRRVKRCFYYLSFKLNIKSMNVGLLSVPTSESDVCGNW